jgi:hypothetical protein
MHVTRESREALSRARFFLAKSERCSADDRLEFEAFLEAAILFARAALHRLQAKYRKHPKWKAWWDSLRGNAAIEFFRTERDWILKEASPRIGQRVFAGGSEAVLLAGHFYYFTDPSIPATTSIETHLASLEKLVKDAENSFS